MRHRWLLPILAVVVTALPMSAQKGADSNVVMPAGTYVIAARDTAKAKDIAVLGWAFVVKGTTWTMSDPTGLTFSGTMVQKNGTMTVTSQDCGDPGVYLVKRQGDGYVWDMQSEKCTGRDSGFVVLLFRPKTKK